MSMYSDYEKMSAADSYIIGFCSGGKIYMTEYTNIPAELLKEEKASRNQGVSLRLRIRSAVKKEMVNSAICLGDMDIISDSKYNKGEAFEKAVTNYFGMEWKKDNIPFYVAGDISVNGKEIQIKFEGATLCNSKQMEKLMAMI